VLAEFELGGEGRPAGGDDAPERKRLELVEALSTEPELVLLDEGIAAWTQRRSTRRSS
jgi:ABC-type branched-subunit amino acid transport system ATPase component